MLISICIPHYNRAQYLLIVLESISKQDHLDIEVIISDDASTDDSERIIPEYIASLAGESSIQFRYFRQSKNLGYDANLRASWAAAHGKYLFTLGNDDALSNDNALSQLASVLERLQFPDVIVANYHPYGKPDQVARRAQQTIVIGSGPDVAVRTFRSFSFIAGVIFKAEALRKHDTSQYDGSIYIQIYLAARIIASGGTLASIEETMVANNVRIGGEVANSYLDVLARDNHTFMRKTGGLDQVGRVACDAILPFVSIHERSRYAFVIYSQILVFSYPYWLYDYRKNGAYRAAINLALGCFPPNLVKDVNISTVVQLGLLAVYSITTSVGLFMPIWVLENLKRPMVRLSKSIKSRGRSTLIASRG